MKFALDQDQLALQDATRDFFASRCDSDVIREAIVSESGYDKALFASLCEEMGLASLVIPESDGGFGATDVELGVALEQHGYFLIPTPLRSHVSAAILVDECASEDFRSDHLSRLTSGDQLATAIFGDEDHTLIVDTTESALNITGRFARVLFGSSIRHLYFPCVIDEKKFIAHLDCQSEGVSQFLTPSLDQTQPLGAIECEKAIVTIVSSEVGHNFERAKARATIAACNEMVGSTQAVLDMSVSYAKDRVQFGRPIGSFQAIKHKCAEMLLETESARSIALYGSWLASQEPGFTNEDLEDDIVHIASMAKYYCSNALNHCTGENIQIHGGIGFTMEHDAQLYFKRAAFMNAHLGLPSEHSRYISQTLLERSTNVS